MMRKMVAVCVALLAASAAAAALSQADTVANLRAFAKLYGYVRFFHPSDEASSIDWDRFAVHGAGNVLACASEKELLSTLNRLFLPLAPSLQIHRATTAPKPVWLPKDTSGLKLVAWRHEGVELGQGTSSYRSIRSNRVAKVAVADRLLFQMVRAPDSTARRVRVRVWARASGQDRSDPPGLWLSVAEKNNPSTSSVNLIACEIDSAAWLAYEAVANLPPAPLVDLTLGAYCSPAGSLWLDDFEIAEQDDAGLWQPLVVQDAGFEDTAAMEASDVWWCNEAVCPSRKTENVHAGARCLYVEAASQETDTTGFFASVHLKPCEYVDKMLDRGLACRLPLCLYSDANHTLPYADAATFARLGREVSALETDSLSGRQLGVRAADVVIVWNILQHFYPYFDVVGVDWDTVLTTALLKSLADTSAADFLNTLRKMAVALQDAHASAGCPAVTGERLVLPCRVELVEGRVAVVATRDTNRFRLGDVILAVDGEPVDARLAKERELVSGSPQFRTAHALRRLVAGPKDSLVGFTIWRATDTLVVTTKYDYGSGPMGVPVVFCDAGDSIRQLKPGIWYVDLSRARMPAIDSVLDRLASARGVVFDVRDFPLGDQDVLRHLLTVPDTSSAWVQTPQIVYPDRERIVGWNKSGWGLSPAEPHIKGKAVFLTSSRLLSYAESFMEVVDAYRLGDIVGQPTAGTNGEVNPFALPGGYSFPWTGLKVTKIDGSQHHLIGIQPTVPLERTLKAVREGRDEYIEKAVELVRGPVKNRP